MRTQETRWLDHLRLNARGYCTLLAIGVALMVIGKVWMPPSPAQYTMYAVASGIGSFVLFQSLAPHGIAWRAYMQQNSGRYTILFLMAALLVLIGWIWKAGPVMQQFLYAEGGTVIGLLVFQSFTDYNNAKFVAEILNQQALSFHVGARLYESHHDDSLMDRDVAVRKYVKGKDVIRLLTSTADDYVLPDREAYSAVCERLDSGSMMQILLFTPIYNLRSFLDTQTGAEEASQSSKEGAQTHGQHHRPASYLVEYQRRTIIPAIKDLMEKFRGKVEARFFYVSHHVNMVIYGERRIFSAPFLLGTNGKDLPCLEVFPGLVSRELFEKMEREFNYIWGKEKLYFSLAEMEEIYAHIAQTFGAYLTGSPINGVQASEFEDYARTLLAARVTTVDVPRNPSGTAPPTTIGDPT